MRIFSFLLLSAGLVVAGSASAARSDAGPADVPAVIQQALDAPARGDDAKTDDRRKPAAVLMFSGVAPGDTVVELVPGTGYWTKLFSAIVGETGHVIAVVPTAAAKHHTDDLDTMKRLAARPVYDNVEIVTPDADALASLDVPPADLVFTAQNLHDFANEGMGGITPKAFAEQIKPLLARDGVLLVNDHAASAGSGLSHTGDLHRIDPALVKRQIVAAGFVFDGASQALANPDDPHDIKVFDPSIRGQTDAFIYRFVLPERSDSEAAGQ